MTVRSLRLNFAAAISQSRPTIASSPASVTLSILRMVSIR
ncbi:Uncharacterised protein [Vibrio cholerae]|nr:Uncharacterised protein [Vibrio cholerae]CSC21179.1 Uncharacterised protein [Vibrio cholerae]